MNQTPQNNFGTPSDNWASGHQPSRKDPTRWVPAMIVGALLFATGCGSGLAVGWFAGYTNNMSDFLSDMDFDAEVTVETLAPHSVIVNEPFEISLLVTDALGKDRTIQDIDFSGSLCDNMRIVSINPNPRRITTETSYIEHDFEQSLLAGQTTEFIFEIIADHTGAFNATIEVYMENYNSESTSVIIQVEPNE
jgi:hypothetical protein